MKKALPDRLFESEPSLQRDSVPLPRSLRPTKTQLAPSQGNGRHNVGPLLLVFSHAHRNDKRYDVQSFYGANAESEEFIARR